MITGQVIDTLYRKYRRPPGSADDLDLSVLFDGDLADLHELTITPQDELVLGKLDDASPFRTVPMSHIHGLVPFEKWVAVVLPASIIFLHRHEPKINLNLKPLKQSFVGRMRQKLSGD